MINGKYGGQNEVHCCCKKVHLSLLLKGCLTFGLSRQQVLGLALTGERNLADNFVQVAKRDALNSLL